MTATEHRVVVAKYMIHQYSVIVCFVWERLVFVSDWNTYTFRVDQSVANRSSRE